MLALRYAATFRRNETISLRLQQGSIGSPASRCGEHRNSGIERDRNSFARAFFDAQSSTKLSARPNPVARCTASAQPPATSCLGAFLDAGQFERAERLVVAGV